MFFLSLGLLRIAPRHLVQFTKYSKSNSKVIGIETSCDDTGCAVVNCMGNVLGDSLYSQNEIHLRYGGIIPLVAHDYHRKNIEPSVKEALGKANLTINDVDAIAVTTKPGLLISLQVGVKYAKYLAKLYNKPLIPIHHMEAHALTARMYNDIPFPYIVLLISGGNCLLALVRDINHYLLLGKNLDNSPGEIMDKVARRLKLRNISDFSKVAGGRAIELAAQRATCPEQFVFPVPLVRKRDCNFSFSGIKDSLFRKLLQKEKQHGVIGDGIIPEVNDLCAAFQTAVTEHLIHRTERAIAFCEKMKFINCNKNIVVSGGVACNDFIFKSLEALGSKRGYKFHRPPPKVCTDNGIMIAWNGIEKLQKNCDIVSDISLKDIDPKAPLGTDIIDKVIKADLPVEVSRIKKLNMQY